MPSVLPTVRRRGRKRPQRGCPGVRRRESRVLRTPVTGLVSSSARGTVGPRDTSHSHGPGQVPIMTTQSLQSHSPLTENFPDDAPAGARSRCASSPWMPKRPGTWRTLSGCCSPGASSAAIRRSRRGEGHVCTSRSTPRGRRPTPFLAGRQQTARRPDASGRDEPKYPGWFEVDLPSLNGRPYTAFRSHDGSHGALGGPSGPGLGESSEVSCGRRNGDHRRPFGGRRRPRPARRIPAGRGLWTSAHAPPCRCAQVSGTG
jgi:hypothetical protein